VRRKWQKGGGGDFPVVPLALPAFIFDRPKLPMRLLSIHFKAYSLPLRRPLRTAHGTFPRRDGFLVSARSAAGLWGFGEAAPLPGFGAESLDACRVTLERLSHSLVETEIDPGALLGQGLCALPDGNELAETPAAAHGLELALLDLLAQERALPLARLLHPLAATEVPVNAVLGAESAAATAQAALEAVAEGFGTLKLKVGADPLELDLARLRAVRNAAGPDVRLRLDANGGWSEAQALAALDALHAFGIEYVEQPVSPDDFDALARVAARSPIPIAADESVRSLPEARRLLAHGLLRQKAAQVLILKPMVLGGVVPALIIAREALRSGVLAVITTSLEGAVGRAGALHAAAALCPLLPEPIPAFGLATGELLAEDLVPAPQRPVNGAMALEELPGLGFRSRQFVLPRLDLSEV
jgi:o-succinylbenzoate synthase